MKNMSVRNLRDYEQMVRQLQGELKQQQGEIKKLKSFKSEFLRLINHEFRTPLTVIKESVAQLADKLYGEVNAQQAHLLELAGMNAQRLAVKLELLIKESEKERP